VELEKNMNADVAAIDLVLSAIEARFAADARRKDTVTRADRISEQVFVFLIAAVLMVCATIAIASARFVMTRGSELWIQFSDQKPPVGSPAP
jgi:hypothetical protein